MSRFFRGESSSEDSASDYEADVPKVQAQAQSSTVSRFAYSSSSESEDAGPRVIRTEKEKRYEEMRHTIKAVRNALKISDFVAASREFDKLNKQLHKAKNITSREGLPKFFFKLVLFLEKEVASYTNSMRKKLSTTNAKSLNGLKMTLRKKHKEYERELAAYAENPLISEEEEEESDVDEDDGDLEGKTGGGGDGGEEEDEEEWSSEDEEWDTDSDDSDDIDMDALDQTAADKTHPMFTRAYWMKKPEADETEKEAQKRADREKRQEERRQRAEARRQANLGRLQARGDTDKADAKRRAEQEYSNEMVLKKLKDVLGMMGKKNTNRVAMIDDLELLNRKAKDPAALLKVRTTLVAAYFEANLNKSTHMNKETWEKCYTILSLMVRGLLKNPSLRLSEDEEVEEKFEGEDDEDVVYGQLDHIISGSSADRNEASESKRKEDEDSKQLEEEDGVQYVQGNMFGFIHRLAQEHFKGLQNTDHHSQEYVERLGLETMLLELIRQARTYYKGNGKLVFESQCVMEELELQHYKYTQAWDAIQDNKRVEHTGRVSNELIDKCKFLYRVGSTRERTRALLVHVYHLALHNYFDDARDLLLMSHVQDNINDADVNTRILFNRTMAQVGLCCFRAGNFSQALNCLQDFFQSQRVKELLAQGYSPHKFGERDPEAEKLHKLRQFPYHMHINFDYLETVHFIAAMFAEAPHLVETPYLHTSRRIMSKPFRRIYDNMKRQPFVMPPENSRDYVMVATRALLDGRYKECFEGLMALKLWPLVTNAEYVQGLLKKHIQEVSLKLFLLKYGCNYATISQKSLEERFEMAPAEVYRVVTRMVYDGQLEGSWDQPNGVVVMRREVLSQLQKVAVSFAEKAALFVEQNERLVDGRHGYYQAKQADKKWARSQKNKNTVFASNREKGADNFGGNNGRFRRGNGRDRHGGGRYNRDQERKSAQ